MGPRSRGAPRAWHTTDSDGNFSVLGNPLWCSDLWCYVDPSDCNVETIFANSYVNNQPNNAQESHPRGPQKSERTGPRAKIGDDRAQTKTIAILNKKRSDSTAS